MRKNRNIKQVSKTSAGLNATSNSYMVKNEHIIAATA